MTGETPGGNSRSTDANADADRCEGRDARLASHLAQCVAPPGEVSVRRLGRSYGIFHAGVRPDAPIALVRDGEVYFKAGPDTVTRFIAAGMRPYRPGPAQPLRGYWRVPPEIVADPAALRAWAADAADAARRFGNRRPTRFRRKRRANRGGR